jgi:hypothetical protein
MSAVPGMGIVRGMGLTLRRFFQPKATIQWPEEPADVAPRYRGGIDTKGRFHVHWGPPETYGERREESAVRRAGRPVPDPAYTRFDPFDTAALDEILERHDYDAGAMLAILEETQAEYGYLPVGALKHISRITGAWYAMIYGTASYYRHLRFEPPTVTTTAPAGEAHHAIEAAYRASLDGSLGFTPPDAGGAS